MQAVRAPRKVTRRPSRPGRSRPAFRSDAGGRPIAMRSGRIATWAAAWSTWEPGSTFAPMKSATKRERGRS